MLTIIPDTILRAVCWTLLHSLWQGLIVALLAGIIMVLTKRSSSSLRYNLLCGLLFLFLAASGFTFFFQLKTGVNEPPAISAVTPIVNNGQPALVPDKPMTAPAVTHTLQTGIDSLIQYFNAHAALIVLIWFIVFLARFVQLLSGVVYTQRIRHYKTSAAPAHWQARFAELLNKLQLSRPVLLLESALIKVPVVVGFLKPVILVPVGMLTHIAPDQVESILLHELAHIRRQDYLLNIVQNLVDTLFFFNPAMIWISSLIRAERENCCDDIAIRETRSRRRLIEALVSFHEYEKTAAGYALSFAAKENQVVRRVKRIVHKTNHSLNAGERVLLMGGLLILSAAFITINNSRTDTQGKSPRASAVTPATVSAGTTAAHVPAPAVPAARPVPTTIPSAGNGSATTLSASPVASIRTATPALLRDTTPKTQSPANPYENVSIDKLIEAKEHGVTPEFVGELQRLGYKNISLDQAIRLKDHGVTTEFISDLQSQGYAGVNLNKAVELRDHGVTSEYIEGLRGLGFSDLPLDKAVYLRDHGVTVEYITGMKKRFGKLLELNDYIKLRDAGISPDSIEQQ
jgi:bla regulator protein BlaR1